MPASSVKVIPLFKTNLRASAWVGRADLPPRPCSFVRPLADV